MTKPRIDPAEWLTPRKVARLLGIRAGYVAAICKKAGIPFRLTACGKRRWDRKCVELMAPPAHGRGWMGSGLAAYILGVSRQKIYDACGERVCYYLTPGGQYRWDPDGVLELAKAGMQNRQSVKA